MKTRYAAILAIALTASLLQFAAAETCIETNTVYFTSTDDHALAASKLFSVLKARGENVTKASLNEWTLIWEKPGLGKTVISTRMTADHVDRIEVLKIYRIKFRYKHSDVMKELVWQANRNYSVGIYSTTDDGDLSIAGNFIFDDRLDVNMLEKYCRWFDSIDIAVLPNLDPNAMEYFDK